MAMLAEARARTGRSGGPTERLWRCPTRAGPIASRKIYLSSPLLRPRASMESPPRTPPASAALLLDRKGRRYEPAVGPRLRLVLFGIFAGVAILGATGIYLFAISTLESLQGQVLQNFFSLSMVLVHVLVGVAVVIPFVVFGCIHLVTARRRTNRRAIRLGMLLFAIGGAVC